MKIIYFFFFVSMMIVAKAQVGINTSTPSSTFEVHKSSLNNVADGIIPPRISADSLALNDNLYGKAQNGALVLVTKPVTSTSQKTGGITSSGYYIYDAYYTHANNAIGAWKKMFSDPNAFAAKGTSGITLLTLGLNLLGSDFRTIVFDTGMIKEIGSEMIVGNQYVVPETGLYNISYSIRFGQGLTTQLLSNNTPGGVIAKTDASGTLSVLDFSLFGGVNLLALVNVSLSEARINHIYKLNVDEKLNFGVITGGLSLSLLGNASADISIYKIR